MFQATSRMKMVASTKVPTLVIQSTLSSPSTGYMKEKGGAGGGGVRFVRSVQSHDPRKPRQFDNRFDNLDKAMSKDNQDRSANNPSSSDDKTTGDHVMSSYGEGYATRSDEEGFGGIYGGSITADNNNEEKLLQEDHPACDKTQGSQDK